MPVGSGELHDLVLDRGTVSRSPAADRSTIEGRLSQMPRDQFTQASIGPGEVAWELTRVGRPLQRGKPVRVWVAVLAMEAGKIRRTAVDPRRGPRLEARYCKSNIHKRLRDFKRCRISRPAGRHAMVEPKMDLPAEKRSRRQHNRPRLESPAIPGNQADDRPAPHHEFGDRALRKSEPRLTLEQRAHRASIQTAVTLRPRRPDRRPLRPIEHPELDAREIGGPPHDATKRVDLAHDRALCNPADGGIARHLTDRLEILREKQGAGAGTRGECGGFRARVATPDDDDVEVRHAADLTAGSFSRRRCSEAARWPPHRTARANASARRARRT